MTIPPEHHASGNPPNQGSDRAHLSAREAETLARKDMIWDIQRRAKAAREARRRAKANADETALLDALHTSSSPVSDTAAMADPVSTDAHAGVRPFWREQIYAKAHPKDDGLHRHKRTVRRTAMQDRVAHNVQQQHPATATTLVDTDGGSGQGFAHHLIRFAALMLIPAFGLALVWLAGQPTYLHAISENVAPLDLAVLGWGLVAGGLFGASTVSLLPWVCLLLLAFTGAMIDHYLHWHVSSSQSIILVIAAVICFCIWAHFSERRDRFARYLAGARDDIANRKDADHWAPAHREQEAQRLADKMMADDDARQRDKDEIARLRAARRW
jgi:hypothetical protein